MINWAARSGTLGMCCAIRATEAHSLDGKYVRRGGGILFLQEKILQRKSCMMAFITFIRLFCSVIR